MPIPPKTPLIALMRLEAKHVAALNKILAVAIADLDKQIKKMGSDNPITVMQARAQREAMNDFMNRTFDSMEDVARLGMSEAAVAASRVVSQYEDELLKLVLDKSTMANLAKSEANRAAAGLNAALKRMQGTSYVPLSQTVYKTKQLASGWVDDLINKALASGWSRQRLAQELRKSIDPKVPGGVSYAANRTARTEINNAFHAASADRYMNSVIVESVDWHLSSSHPEGDICDQLEADSPYPKKEVPKKPHPNCYCYITPHLPTEDEFLDNLFAGKYDPEDAPWINEVQKNKVDKSYQVAEDALLKMTAKQLSDIEVEHTKRYFDYTRQWQVANPGVHYEVMWADEIYESLNEYRIKIRDLKSAALLAEKNAPKAARGARAAAKKPVPKAEAKTPVVQKKTTPQTWNKDGDTGIQAKYNKGYTVERILSEDSANGTVYKIRFADGTYGVLKRSNRNDSINENLAAQALERLGVRAPKSATVWHKHQEHNVFDFADGMPPYDAAEMAGFDDVDEYIASLIGKNTGLEEMVRADFIIGNTDRHMGNWLITKDGKISAIDHGLSLDTSLNERQTFDAQDSAVAFISGNNDRAKELAVGWDAAKVRSDLSEIKDMFVANGKLEQWENMMHRVDLLDEAFKQGTLQGLR